MGIHFFFVIWRWHVLCILWDSKLFCSSVLKIYRTISIYGLLDARLKEFAVYIISAVRVYPEEGGNDYNAWDLPFLSPCPLLPSCWKLYLAIFFIDSGKVGWEPICQPLQLPQARAYIYIYDRGRPCGCYGALGHRGLSSDLSLLLLVVKNLCRTPLAKATLLAANKGGELAQ